MRTGIKIIAGFAAGLLFLSIFVLISCEANEKACSAAWPFIAIVGLILALAVVGLVVDRLTTAMFCITGPLLCLQLLLAVQTAFGLPAGNNDIGMAWAFLVWSVSGIACVASFILIVLNIIDFLIRTRPSAHVRGRDAP